MPRKSNRYLTQPKGRTGRPPVGKAVNITLPVKLLDTLRNIVENRSSTMSQVLREIITKGMRTYK